MGQFNPSSPETSGYKCFHLDSRAIKYVCGRLCCGNQLAHRLLETLASDVIELKTFLPKVTAHDKVYNLQQGGIADSKITKAWLVREIQVFLHRHGEGIVVLENSPARRGDAIITSYCAREDIGYFRDNVYHILRPSTLNSTSVGDVCEHAEAAHLLIGAMVSKAPLKGIVCGARELDSADIKQLAERTSTVVVSAYDGEGYLLGSSTAFVD